MFLTQDKVLKRIHQDRQRGDLKKAHKRALDAVKRWPDDYDLALEAVQLCFDLSDYHQAVSILKSAIRHHPKNRTTILSYAQETYRHTFNPFLGSFIIESLLRSRDIEGIRGMLASSSDAFISDLIKRSETRSKGWREEGRSWTSTQTDNELLLGLLYCAGKEHEKAPAVLGRVLDHSPEDALLIGQLLVEVEREQPRSAEAKYHLGLASLALSHPDKAEPRFFQCLSLPDPPLEKMLITIDSMKEKSKNHQLLKAEILIRMKNFEEGVNVAWEYLEGDTSQEWKATSPEGQIKQLFPGHIDRKEFVLDRFARLPEHCLDDCGVTFILCEAALALEKIKETVAPLERLATSKPEHTEDIIRWIEEHETIAQTAPGQLLLTSLHLERGALAQAAKSARMAADMDASRIPALGKMIDAQTKKGEEVDPALLLIQAELKARSGNLESAEEILGALQREDTIDTAALSKLTGEIIKHCGTTLGSLISAIEISLKSGNVNEPLPYLIEFCRGNPDAHRELADDIRQAAEDHTEYWPAVAELIDLLAKEEELSNPLRMLQATAHLETGAVERAVFEFDQLIMFDETLRLDLIGIYTNTLDRYRDNTTLNLALYQLHLDEGQLAEAAHYLCRTLELDPSQIKDVVARFNKLIEQEPDNQAIWEEMLKTALEIRHVSLAKEILGRAVGMLPHEQSAALHIYGARISTADGKNEDALRCIAMTLTSPQADFKHVEDELQTIIKREPSNAEAQYLLGETLVHLGKEDEAVMAFTRCLEHSTVYRSKIESRLEQLMPTSVKPWLISRILAEIAWAEGRPEDAYQLFGNAQQGSTEALHDLSSSLEHLRSNTPEDKRLTLIHAHTLTLEGQCEAAVDLLEALVQKDHSYVGSAIDLLLECIEKQPDQPDANRLLAKLYLEAGDTEKSLEPIRRMLTSTEIAPEELDRFAADFLEAHGENCRFLIPYAAVKAKRGAYDEALTRYQQALELDPTSWEKIIVDLDSHSWPDRLYDTSRLLKIDCLLEGERTHGAFELISKYEHPDPQTAEKLLSRVLALIEHKPEKEYFTLGCRLLAGAGRIDKAEELIGRGCETLSAEDCTDLKIELAEAFQGQNLYEEARNLFREVLGGADDRRSILHRIEKTYIEWTDQEVQKGLRNIEAGRTTNADTARLVRLCLDQERPELALDVIKKSNLPERIRPVLLAMTYLCMDRPTLALASVGAAKRGAASSDDIDLEIRYLDGLASERLGLYGRAAAAFSAILGTHGEFRDSRCRAEQNYVKFIEYQFEDEIQVLEKTGNLTSRSNEGEDEP